MPERFLNSTKRLALSRINLKLFLEFYKEYICKYSFKYTLENNTNIIISFEEENFPHLIGLHKIKRIKHKQAKELNKDIINEKIEFKQLYKAEKDAIDKNLELIDRITYFGTLRTLLDNASFVLKYDVKAISQTSIEFSFLLNSTEISVIIYLAIKEITKKETIYVPVSFLVDRYKKFEKMELEKIKIIGKEIKKQDLAQS